MGNLKTRTDFNNRTTDYDYDDLNRLTKKTPDPVAFPTAVPIEFTYTLTGRRDTMKDAFGTTSYSYHALSDRLTSKSNQMLGGISYTYDAAGNLTSLSTSGAAAGLSVTYAYDDLNRLETVSNADTGTTRYTYDEVGNLATVTQPNNVLHAYTYDDRNRLTNLAVNGPGATPPALASYTYTLAPTGHRLSVAELSGRNVSYGYDKLYRLTSEIITGDTSTPTPQNGSITYTYDAVGNRQERGSTVPAIPPIAAGLLNYDANDRFTGATADVYDNNGNTIGSAGFDVTYDFENRILTRDDPTVANDTVSTRYNGDGQRVEKIVQTGPGASITTRYLVDDLNPTGYEQVLVETTTNNNFARRYVYGLDLISQRRQLTFNTFENRYYSYDGHGSVRQLTDDAGAITDTYTYDAFGNLIAQTFTGAAPTPNHYLYAGEQFDSDLGLYYNRARYFLFRSRYALTRICQSEYTQGMESVFAVIAEPNRRAILRLLVSSQQSVGAIERQLRMPQPTVSKHLRVLREAGFVESTVDAQRRLYRLKPEPLQELDAWLAPFRRFWTAHLDALERHLDRMEQSTRTKRKTRRRR